MALIDDVFGGIPKSILANWGRDITYVKTTTPRTYDPTTGAVTGADTTVTVKALITSIDTTESEGLYQTTDIVVFGADEQDVLPNAGRSHRYSQAAKPAKPRFWKWYLKEETTQSCTPSSRGRSNG